MNNIKIPILISKINKYQRKEINYALKKYKIDSTQGVILLKLKEYGALTSKELVNLYSIEKSSISKNIKKLYSLHYIIKEADSHDARSFKIYLSEEGKKIAILIENSLKNINEIFKNFISPNTISELENLIYFLNKK